MGTSTSTSTPTTTLLNNSLQPTNSTSSLKTTAMAEGLKVRFTYKPDSSSTPEEYWVVANPGMPDKWKQDPSTPLTDVLQSFDIFKGHGQAGQAPHADLLKVFGTTDNDAVIRKILSEGDWPKEKGFTFTQHKNQKTMKKEK